MSPYREPASGYDPPTSGFDHWPERERDINIALSYARNTDRILDRYSGPPGRCERDVLDRAAAGQRVTCWRVL